MSVIESTPVEDLEVLAALLAAGELSAAKEKTDAGDPDDDKTPEPSDDDGSDDDSGDDDDDSDDDDDGESDDDDEEDDADDDEDDDDSDDDDSDDEEDRDPEGDDDESDDDDDSDDEDDGDSDDDDDDESDDDDAEGDDGDAEYDDDAGEDDEDDSEDDGEAADDGGESGDDEGAAGDDGDADDNPDGDADDGEAGDADDDDGEAEEPKASAASVEEVAVVEEAAVELVEVVATVAMTPVHGVTEVVASDHAQNLRLVEALIFAGTQTLDEKALAERLPEDADIPQLLADLGEFYANRGVNLIKVAGGYAFRTAPDLSERLKIERPVTRKLSRASVETLAIIAYHQPVTRAEIEQVRGVGLSKGTLDLLFEQNWIKPMGRRRAPGKPVTWGTTDFFLEHFGLPSLDDLPGQEELKAAGLLDPRSQPPIFRPEEPDLPLEPTEDEAAEPLAADEQGN